MKFYTDLSILNTKNLKNLNPILSFLWNELPLNCILNGQISNASSFNLTNNPEEADWFLLPMYWSYYLWNNKANLDEAIRLSNLAKNYNKKVLLWHKGDLIPIIPFDNGVVFLPGMLRSNKKDNQRACPAFIKDPARLFENSKVVPRHKTQKPIVGFCGYASINLIKLVWSIVKGIQLNIASQFGKYEYEGVPIIPATSLRARALEYLSRDKRVETRFIIRDKYFGNNPKINNDLTLNASEVFYSNIYNSDYTLCLRGYGNWSYRFYETLACGRIPVFIDTDCVLPLSSKIDWKNYCVWIDKTELKYIGEKIADFHSSLSPDDFVEKHLACRKLWEEYLKLESFAIHFSEYL